MSDNFGPGADGSITMRSDSRLLVQDPKKFEKLSPARGTDPDVVKRIPRTNSSMRGEAEMIDYMDRAPDDIVRVRDDGSTTTDRVRRILEYGLWGDWPSPDEIAARLTTSPQNLRRQLREEGTSISGEIHLFKRLRRLET